MNRRSHHTRHNTGNRALGDWTVGSYAPRMNAYDKSPKWGLRNAKGDALRVVAKRRGWTVRADPRGWVKCFDPKTGNCSFSPTYKRAIVGLLGALDPAKEINHYIIKMMIEG